MEVGDDEPLPPGQEPPVVVPPLLEALADETLLVGEGVDVGDEPGPAGEEDDPPPLAELVGDVPPVAAVAMHEQTAAALVEAARALPPQALTTQFSADAWRAAELEHWQA